MGDGQATTRCRVMLNKVRCKYIGYIKLLRSRAFKYGHSNHRCYPSWIGGKAVDCRSTDCVMRYAGTSDRSMARLFDCESPGRRAGTLNERGLAGCSSCETIVPPRHRRCQVVENLENVGSFNGTLWPIGCRRPVQRQQLAALRAMRVRNPFWPQEPRPLSEMHTWLKAVVEVRQFGFEGEWADQYYTSARSRSRISCSSTR